MKIRPGAARELLISALKVLVKDKRSILKRPAPQVNEKKEIFMDFQPEIIPIEPTVALSAAVPCKHDIMSDVALASEASDVPSTENGRRFIAAATGVAANPYTGMLHYVHYPVYYPSHPYYG